LPASGDGGPYAEGCRNPIGILVPCHRLIGADGSLTGFADGLERKAFVRALDNPGRSAQPCGF